MKLIFVISISFLLSCNYSYNGEKLNKPNDTTIIEKKIVNDSFKTSLLTPKVDSFINQFNFKEIKIEKGLYKVPFDFNNYSTEGGEGYAYYDKYTKLLIKTDIYLYEQTKQVNINYHFFIDKVKVKEIVYKYKKNIQDVNSEKDMIRQPPIYYTIYLKDRTIAQLGEYRVGIFEGFKKLVPLSIKF